MALEFSGFFDSTGGVERSYGQSDLASAFRALGGTGAASLEDGLRVTAEGSTMRTLVQPGLAMVQGYVYELSDDGGAVQAFEHPASASSDRIDRVALRLDLNQSRVLLTLLTGAPGAHPTPPALTRTATAYEISLAQVRVRAGASAIAAQDVTDERADETVCGALCPEALRLGGLYERLDIPLCSQDANGLMAAADKTYLDALSQALSVSQNAVDLGGKYLDNALFR